MSVAVGDDLALQRATQRSVLLGPHARGALAIAEHAEDDTGEMARLRVSIDIGVPAERAWAEIAELGDHVHWMADAVAIRFLTEQRRDVGTTFECDTKVGPLRTTDRMRVVGWQEGESVTVEHHGLVRGTGTLGVAPVADGRCRVEWAEDLQFPWWLGGAVTERIARLVLLRVWQGNLRRLSDRLR